MDCQSAEHEAPADGEQRRSLRVGPVSSVGARTHQVTPPTADRSSGLAHVVGDLGEEGVSQLLRHGARFCRTRQGNDD